MATNNEFDPEAFKTFEHSGWVGLADSYYEVTRSSTVEAAGYLLDAAGVGAGTRLLDIACGPGYSAGLAAERGAIASGVDFAGPMVAKAATLFPAASFTEGDAEALPFDDASFDAVVCAFGMLHFSRPEMAMAEACRVLVPGGHYAFSVWSTPDRVQTFGIYRGAIETHGTFDVPLPEGPPMFRFSDPEECKRTLLGAGFVEPEISEIPIVRRTTPDGLVASLSKTSVRMNALIQAQTEDARERIFDTIREEVGKLATNGVADLQMPAVLASARKP